MTGFKWVKGYEGLYKINEDGVVYSCYYRKIMRSWISKKYPRIRLSKNGKVKNFFVHRLVADNYLEPSEKNHINHIDGNKLNNNYKNLEWCTPQENSDHAVVTGLITSYGENNNKSKLTEKDVIKIFKLLENRTESYKLIGKKFGVTRYSISMIDKGVLWKHMQHLRKNKDLSTKRVPRKKQSYYDSRR